MVAWATAVGACVGVGAGAVGGGGSVVSSNVGSGMGGAGAGPAALSLAVMGTKRAAHGADAAGRRAGSPSQSSVYDFRVLILLSSGWDDH